LLNHLANLSQGGGLSIDTELIDQKDNLDGLLTANITSIGNETDIMKFIANIESRIPLIRVSEWTIENQPDDEKQLQLNVKIMAIWVDS